MKVDINIFDELTSTERLFEAWFEFRKGKMKRRDVQEFSRHAEKNIFRLHRDLVSQTYRHGEYESFFIHDPKLRHIRKACVRDRLVHQTLYTTLRQIYEPRLIEAVYSSRLGKGTHSAIDDLRRRIWKTSRNFSRQCWALKCDIRRFYDSVDHEILLFLLNRRVEDRRVLNLLQNVVESFHVEGAVGKGAPIGNLTSQIFTNIYLNEFDQFVKHGLKVKHYLRFADDMIFLSYKKEELQALIPSVESYLKEHLKLRLHPDKIILRPVSQGIDFLGYVTFPHHRVMRTATRKRMVLKLAERHDQFYDGKVSAESLNQSLQSYLGILSHADAYDLSQEVENVFSWRDY